ncbi:hypothetical protein LUZ60_009436 [Juncus effusus]|nr:hypothetical protein LUZ60_009436 [Juncus effusus]
MAHLIQELKDRIAAASAASASAGGGDDQVELVFRTVLPKLLHAYVNPPSTENVKEMTAVLKLLTYTANKHPGVFFHGRAAAVLPTIGRIFPFLAEPTFSSRHSVIFETISSLLSLLRTGDREIYRQFFLDTITTIEDVLHIATGQGTDPSSKTPIICLCNSFARISNSPVIFSEVPAGCQLASGQPGVVVDLSGDARWGLFAASMVKFVNKCLTEGTLYVEGLIDLSFVSNACSLVCYGDPDLQMACFDFARIVAMIVDIDIIPVESMICSIACILGQDKMDLANFRDLNYDSSLGTCLHVLHSSCNENVVKSTANDIISVFITTLESTESSELKIAMCSAYKRILQIFPCHIWKPEILIKALYTSKPSFQLVDCIRLVISTFGTGNLRNNDSETDEFDSVKVGEKRKVEERESGSSSKRQKLMNGAEREFAEDFNSALIQLIEILKPGRETGQTGQFLRQDRAIENLCLLCVAFSDFESLDLSGNVFGQVVSWMPWIYKQMREEDSVLFDLFLYLEAIQSILLLQDKEKYISPAENQNELINVLKVAWHNSTRLVSTAGRPITGLKCLLVRVISKMKLNPNSDLELLDFALNDEDEQVRGESVILLPVFVFFSGPDLLEHMIRRLELVQAGCMSKEVQKSVILSLGFLSCLNESSCKLFLANENKIAKLTALRLIQKSVPFSFKGGFKQFLTKSINFRDTLYDFLSTRLVTHPTLIKYFSQTILSIKTEDLVKEMVPIVVPKLIVSQKGNNRAIVILHELAVHMNLMNAELAPHVELIVNWLPKVLAFVLFHEDKEELASVLEFYHVQTKSDGKEIFDAALQALLDELICSHGDTDEAETNRRTMRIPMIVKEVALILTGSDDLPDFLKDHFVGLLNSIDRKMLRCSDNPQLQCQALRRIQKVIEMMGPYLSTHVHKIMVLLIYTIDKEALQKGGLEVLHFFIKKIDEFSPCSMKHVMTQVVAAFIPSLEKWKECPSVHLMKVVEILKDIIVKNYARLEQEICKLPLLPAIPDLSEVNKLIREARGSRTLRDQLQGAIDGLNHESLNVRYMVACELSKLFNSKREEITSLIIAEDSMNLDIFNSLITSLLRGCGEESRKAVGQRLKLVCADCLGALGAVDPAKFKNNSSERFKIECSDDDLIFELINKHLSRAFRAASDTQVQDSAAFAIQELLKSERAKNLWARFSDDIKETIEPCLTSKFHLASGTDSSSNGPIYRPKMSFGRWIFLWIRKLTALASKSRFSIFTACRGIVRHDMQTALYLLPYLVLNAVCHSTIEARQGITEEILSVLEAAVSENNGLTGQTACQSELCIQAVFTLLDNLGQWVDDLKQEIALSQSAKPKTEISKNGEDLLAQCRNVSELLNAVPKVTLARASFRCQAQARALLYFESHVRENSGSFNPAAETSSVFSDEDISFLMEIYSGLDEPDGLMGFANLRKSSSLQDQLLINEKSGNWADVLTFCEQALQMEPDSVQRHSNVLNCLLNMCHLQAMIAHVDGLIFRIPKYKKTWCMNGVQAAWRLGKWDLMDEYLSGADSESLVTVNETNTCFDMDLAKIFQAMIRKDQFMVEQKIAQSKQALLVPLAAAGMDSYMRAYPYVVKLHMLCELEDFNSLLGENNSLLEKSFGLNDPKFVKVAKDWENRLKITQPSLWAREPLLAFRRLVYSLSSLNSQVGNCWLQYAKLCRSAGHYETAHHAILEAHASGAPNVHMERAKYFWSVKKSDVAIAELQQTLLNMPSDALGPAVISSLSSLSLALPNAPLSATQASKDNLDVAKTLLLYTRWIHYTGQKQKEETICLYSRVRELQPKWEKSYFYMAKYCDDLLVDARKRQEDRLAVKTVGPASGGGTAVEEKIWWTYLPDVLLFYAKGLHKGHKNLFQALPRLLTLWFEFGSIYYRDGSASNKPMKTVHTRVLSVMRGCLKDLPTYQWLTVLSQLISRICHQNEEILRIVKQIITSVLQEYPQQALWMMAAVSKSAVPARRDAANEIISAAKKGSRSSPNQSALFVQFASLIDHLIKLCFHPGNPKSRVVNISSEFSALKRMMPLGIILPVQQALTVTLPSYDFDEDNNGNNNNNNSSFNVFSASEHVTITGIADEAEILSSLQRPKKVVFLGSDGSSRPFLCKPKDDLRKDARMMEFTAMINRLLSKYPESRRRKLYIRTFAVVPLTEDCGMVEWVPHTRGLRHILQDIYITCGKFDRQRTNPMIKRVYDQHQGKTAEDEMLKSKILPMFPPVFHKWFLTTFSEPAAWFRARLAYAHTTAVWSMVGHIVGLGDRHGENILFDSTTGDCVHVDFSCLFDKGLLLDKPELVPFRLTQNMIDGLGITGYEGVFLKVCEITLSVLRTHKETLMSVLETFIHDPLVEWTKSHKSSGVEVQNPHAQRAISNIKARLQGVVVGVAAAPSLPLSVEGQARRLIAEAVSHKNLGKMYIWWMAWF